MRIILADDHIMVRDGLRPFLAALSPQVTIVEADSYGGVVDLIADGGPVDLALVDLLMLDHEPMDGIRAVLDVIRPGKMVVMSSLMDRRTIRAVLALGVDGFVPKRVSAPALVSALQLVLAGETYVPSMLMAMEGLPLKGERGPRSYLDSANLTSREREILRLLRDGMSNKAMARDLQISEVTVKSHLCHMFKKLGVQNRVQAATIGLSMMER